MRALTVICPAKVNLSLDILGRREDGYHEMRTVMQAVSLCDRLTLARRPEPGLRFSCDRMLGDPEKNLALRAARLFFEAAGLGEPGLFLRLEKRIPAAAGLGGGSSDAAGALAGLNTLFDAGFSPARLQKLGLALGADVPFCLRGGTALATGMGEALTPTAPLPDCWLVLVKPSADSPTGAAFAAFDRLQEVLHPDPNAMPDALRTASLEAVAAAVGNVFEQAVRFPEIEGIRRVLRDFGALSACMTGSGSAVFGLFAGGGAARRCAGAFSSHGGDAFVCRPWRTGPVLRDAAEQREPQQNIGGVE